MKNFFLVAVLFCFLKSGAQSFVIIGNDSAAVNTTSGDGFEPVDVLIKIINNQNVPMVYSWKMSDYTAPAAWEVKLCDNNNCYDLLINAGPYDALSIAPGDTLDFKLQYTPHCVSGTGSANVVVYVDGDSAATAQVLNFTADITAACANSVSANQDFPVSLFPNPAGNTMVITGEDMSRVSIEIYDLKGQQIPVEAGQRDASSISINVSAIPAGAYMVRLSDNQGRKGLTRFNKL